METGSLFLWTDIFELLIKRCRFHSCWKVLVTVLLNHSNVSFCTNKNCVLSQILVLCIYGANCVAILCEFRSIYVIQTVEQRTQTTQIYLEIFIENSAVLCIHMSSISHIFFVMLILRCTDLLGILFKNFLDFLFLYLSRHLFLKVPVYSWSHVHFALKKDLRKTRIKTLVCSLCFLGFDKITFRHELTCVQISLSLYLESTDSSQHDHLIDTIIVISFLIHLLKQSPKRCLCVVNRSFILYESWYTINISFNCYPFKPDICMLFFEIRIRTLFF